MAAIKSTFVAVVFIATKIPATKLDNSEDIGVSASQCNGAEVELNHGQLLMCYRNEWRGVCDGKKTFNKTDAEVVCYQLGLSGDVINTNFHCDPSDPNVLEKAEFKDVSCTGREEELHDCSMNTSVGIYDCIAEDCICFQCPEESQVRLFNMTNGADYQGRVQHYYDGGWNELCVEGDSDWTDRNSRVVCQQLGMGIPLRAATKVGPSHPIPRFISSDINCTGSEETIKDCKTQSWTMPSQCSGYVPWVSCEGPPVTITNAISEGLSNSITVEWSINKIKTQHYPVVTGYEVIITNTKIHETYIEIYPGWKRGTATVHGLLSYTEYTITVRALMGEHRGPLSEPMQVKTGPEEVVLGLALSTTVFGLLFLFITFLSVPVCVYCYRQGRNRVPGEDQPDGEGEPDGEGRDQLVNRQHCINEVENPDEENIVPRQENDEGNEQSLSYQDAREDQPLIEEGGRANSYGGTR
jgi:hypothetical protein